MGTTPLKIQITFEVPADQYADLFNPTHQMGVTEKGYTLIGEILTQNFCAENIELGRILPDDLGAAYSERVTRDRPLTEDDSTLIKNLLGDPDRELGL